MIKTILIVLAGLLLITSGCGKDTKDKQEVAQRVASLPAIPPRSGMSVNDQLQPDAHVAVATSVKGKEGGAVKVSVPVTKKMATLSPQTTRPFSVVSSAVSVKFKGVLLGSAPIMVVPATLNTIMITPVAPSTPLGIAKQLTATGIFSDGTIKNISNQAIWHSANSAVASIATNGKVTPVSTGSVLLTAQAGDVTGSVKMTVTPAVLAGLEVTPTSLQMLIGFNGQFIATGLFSDGSKRDITTTAEWQSLNPSLVSSGAGKGNVVPKAVGSTAIVAKMGRFTGTAPISVSAVIAAPTAPSHVTIKQRDDAGQITLSWPVVPGATSYNVYVYDSRSSSFSTVTYHASSPYTKTFKAGTYHFIVTAVNSFGESAPSSWISAQK